MQFFQLLFVSKSFQKDPVNYLHTMSGNPGEILGRNLQEYFGAQHSQHKYSKQSKLLHQSNSRSMQQSGHTSTSQLTVFWLVPLIGPVFVAAATRADDNNTTSSCSMKLGSLLLMTISFFLFSLVASRSAPPNSLVLKMRYLLLVSLCLLGSHFGKYCG